MSHGSGRTLTLRALHERHPGLTAALGETFVEAAAVCLARHHTSPTQIEISKNNIQSEWVIEFTTPDARTMRAWANDIDTTEAGAYGVCIATVEAIVELVVVKRAETLTGADWYLAPRGAEIEDLENCIRLEVSGVDTGSRSTVSNRLGQKVSQARRGKSNLPAIAAVVGFRELIVQICEVPSR